MFQGRMYDYKSAGWGRNWMGVDLFLCVEMAKTLPVFKLLSMDDKVSGSEACTMSFYVAGNCEDSPLGLPPCPRVPCKYDDLPRLLLRIATIYRHDLPRRMPAHASYAVCAS